MNLSSSTNTLGNRSTKLALANQIIWSFIKVWSIMRQVPFDGSAFRFIFTVYIKTVIPIRPDGYLKPRSNSRKLTYENSFFLTILCMVFGSCKNQASLEASNQPNIVLFLLMTWVGRTHQFLSGTKNSSQ